MKSIKTWLWLHKWSSLICTLFMLLLCLTGLPLIFSHEIDHLLGNEIEPSIERTHNNQISLDKVIENAQKIYPNRLPRFIARDIDDDQTWTVSLGEPDNKNENLKFVIVDAHNAKVLGEAKSDEGFMYVMFKLHVDLFAGLPGTLFLGVMGLLLIVSILSGVVLYAPFMRRLDFGDIRKNRGSNLKRLDTHNLIGIVTLVWMLVVGATGVINTCSELLLKYWQSDQIKAMTVSYKNLPLPTSLASLQKSVDAALIHRPGMRLGFVAFPDTSFSSPHHYGVFTRGNTPLTSKLIYPILVDAKTAKVTDSKEIPWYLKTLLLSQPLHFGDYGGLLLKVIWSILDIATIAVLWTGLVLWWRKRNQTTTVNVELTTHLNKAS
jgi:uncharacterized iron-regulated membrane protein